MSRLPCLWTLTRKSALWQYAAVASRGGGGFALLPAWQSAPSAPATAVVVPEDGTSAAVAMCVRQDGGAISAAEHARAHVVEVKGLAAVHRSSAAPARLPVAQSC
jgi:hypothetical protein